MSEIVENALTEPTQARAFEEVVRRNVTACVDHANATRAIVRAQGEEVEFLKRTVATQNGVIAELKSQLAILNAKFLNGGPTSGV
jgi:hypothetical protein